MALTDTHRNSIHRNLSPVIGAEEAEALLAQFPACQADEPATKDFVRAEVAELNEKFGQQTIWFAGAMTSGLTAGMGLAAGIATALGGG